MRYGLSVSSGPAAEPVSTAEAKTHLRVETSDDDTFIDTLVKSARQLVEEQTHRALITQTLTLTLDRFPSGGAFWFPHHDRNHGDHFDHVGVDPAIYLPRSPVQSVTSIQYIDENGDNQTLAASKYKVDTESLVPRIVPAFGEVWPTTRVEINAVTVTFVAGYGLAGSDVPSPIVHAIKLIVGTHYDPVRANVGLPAVVLPQSADFLLGPYKVGTQAGLGA